MLTRRIVALAAALSLLALVPAAAADNYQVKDASGATMTIKSKDVGSGVQSPQFVPSDATGAEKFVPANPGVVDTVVRSTSVDRGGTIATGGAAQSFMAANASRRGFLIQNQHATADLWINCLATAAPNQTSLRVPAGALYETSPHHSGTGACSIYGATTAQPFYAREF